MIFVIIIPNNTLIKFSAKYFISFANHIPYSFKILKYVKCMQLKNCLQKRVGNFILIVEIIALLQR